MAKLLVVVGATGFQGRSVVKWFQREQPSWKIRGLTRNPSSDAAVALAKTGVEIVQADLNDVESLKPAFKGANYIYAYTDFGGIVKSPEVMGKFAAGQLEGSVGAASYRIELQHGKNIADAAATVPELERLIWSALPSIKKWSGGKYTQGSHFDSKAAVTDYLLQTKALEGKVSALHLTSFFNNIINSKDLFGIHVLDDKTIFWQSPFAGDVNLPWIDVEKDAGGFVAALIAAPAPIQLLGVSEYKKCRDWLKLWSEITGVKSKFEEATAKPAPDEDPSGFKLQFWETSKFLEEFGFTGGDPDILSPEDLEKKGISIPRTKIADYIKREDWSGFLEDK